MSLQDKLRRAARSWAIGHDFPFREQLLVQHHRLPSRRLARLSDLLLVPGPGEDPFELVEADAGTTMLVDMRSLAQRSIAYRLSDRQELALLRTLLAPGNVAVDVGANIGLYTLALARAVGHRGRVYALEPNPATAAQLRHNVALNGRPSVYVHELAAADVTRTLELRTPDSSEPGLATTSGPGAPICEVQATTLDEFAAAQRLSHVDLLKIDAEGAELSVLHGATELLGGRVGHVLFEVLDGATEAQQFLVERGFCLHVVLPPGSPMLVRPCRPDERFAYANLLASDRSGTTAGSGPGR